MSAGPTTALRAATEQDLATVLAWSPDEDSLRLWAGPHAEFGVPVEETWRQFTVAPRMTFTLQAEGDTILGMGQLVFNAPGWGHLARLVIDPARRGEGHGRSLCRALMAIARELEPGLIGYTLFVYPHNANALHLYHSLGFEIEGEGEAGLKMKKIVDRS